MTQIVDCRKPKKLYRYAEKCWLEKSLTLGQFCLRPADDYKGIEGDEARQDDELVRTRRVNPSHVTIINQTTGMPIIPEVEVTFKNNVNTNYYMVSFSNTWDKNLFKIFSGSDACLVIHDVNEFTERMHTAVEAVLSGWAGNDAAISYGQRSFWGAVYEKSLMYAPQKEWKFAWRPPEPIIKLEPLIITIGSIENIAEIRDKNH